MTDNVDHDEIARFSAQAAHWWDTQGEFKMLHELNPLRLDYIHQKAPLTGKAVIDIGCGGGILADSMAHLGAKVTGIDMSAPALNVAKLHQLESGATVEYLLKTAEELAKERPGQYDVVTCLEMLEHVPDPTAIIQAAATLLKPGGHAFFSTLNRNVKAYLFAIVGAEYVLKLLPKQTHDFAKFIKPSELEEAARQTGLTLLDLTGIHYHLLNKQFSLGKDISVNYLAHCQKLI